MFGLNSVQANAAMGTFAAAPVLQQRNQSILAASKMVGAGCATIALAGGYRVTSLLLVGAACVPQCPVKEKGERKIRPEPMQRCPVKHEPDLLQASSLR